VPRRKATGLVPQVTPGAVNFGGARTSTEPKSHGGFSGRERFGRSVIGCQNFSKLELAQLMIDKFGVKALIQLHQIAHNSTLIFENPNFS